MRPLGEVQAEILDAITPRSPARVPLVGAAGLVLMEPASAREPVPPFANSAMDGYAVRAADTAGASEGEPVRLGMVGELPAGTAPTAPVGAGEAIRIMTGAPMPEGADAIVMVERTEADGDGVLVFVPAAVGDHVRRAGGDVEAGEVVFDRGEVLTAAHLGVLASLGVTEPMVVPRPRVGVLSTGDELAPPSVPLGPGQIRDSNRPMLLALVAEAGCEPIDLGTCGDDEERVRRVVEDAVERCDALVTSGGVSVGDYDVVKAVLEQMGVLRWSQVAIKPAKPLAVAMVDGLAVFGLPGNPVSAHVSFELFARPALRKLAGHAALHRPVVRARAGEAMARRADGRLHLDRVIASYADGEYSVVRSGAQASNVLSGMARANALAFVPDGEGLAAGDLLDVMLLT